MSAAFSSGPIVTDISLAYEGSTSAARVARGVDLRGEA